jgi:hypothetical protein
LIAKQKRSQTKQERALQDEQHDLRDIKHVEISMPGPALAALV